MTINNVFKKELYNQTVLQLFKKYDSSWCFFMLPQGLGDVLFCLMYMEEFKIRNPEKKICFLVSKKHILDLVNLFSSVIDEIFFFFFNKLDINVIFQKYKKQFYCTYDDIYNTKFPSDNLCYSVRSAMGLPFNSKKSLPSLNIISKNSHKFCLIAPDANSCEPCVSDSKWTELGSFFSQLGYEVYFNVSSDNRFRNFKHLFPTVNETISLLNNKNSFFIGYRSGLCDVVAAFCECKQLIIYPNNRKKNEFSNIKNYNENPNLSYMKYCSLSKIFPEKPNIYELMYSPVNFFNDVRGIVNG